MQKRRRSRNISLNRLFPNLITLAALCSGLSAIRFALPGTDRLDLTVAFLVLAAFLDGLDGRIARLLKATSNFGAQLDSLSDFVCFGVAPGVVMYLWTTNGVKGFGWAMALFFAICGALRLARFNTSLIEADKEPWQKHFFTGVPAPAGAMLCILPLVLSMQFGPGLFDNPLIVAIYTGCIGLLMISRLPTFSIKSQRVDQRMMLPVTIAAVLILVSFITEFWGTLAFLTLCYLASIPVSIARRNAMMRQLESEEEHFS